MSIFNASIFNIAGGLNYHFRAARFRTTLWKNFRSSLEAWFADWHPRAKELILVGPSAGYCTIGPWLGRFERLIVVEPDPLARLLFVRLLQARTQAMPIVEWFTNPNFETAPHSHQLSYLVPVLAKYPKAAVLFCNFLGQLHLLAPQLPQPILIDFLKGREWASFHDRVSGVVSPQGLLAGQFFSKRLSDSEILKKFYRLKSGELIDHETNHFFEGCVGQKWQYLNWQITPDYFHLIEVTSNS